MMVTDSRAAVSGKSSNGAERLENVCACVVLVHIWYVWGCRQMEVAKGCLMGGKISGFELGQVWLQRAFSWLGCKALFVYQTSDNLNST